MVKKTAKKTAKKAKAAKKTSQTAPAVPAQSNVSSQSRPTPGAKIEGEKIKDEKEVPESEWKENLIAILVVLVIILIIWAFVTDKFSPDEPDIVPEQRFPIPIDDDPMLGNTSARVTIIEFSDYFCTACAQFHENTWPQLTAAYIDTGKVRFVYRDFPIESLHPEAYKASATVTCAREQDAYWEFHDAFYERQSEIGEELIEELVATHNLSQELLDECRALEWPYKEAKADFDSGKFHGQVAGTPTFFINGRKIVGAKSFAEFFAIIDEELTQ